MKINGHPPNTIYINLLNWFWEEVPHYDGFKSLYGFLFLAIVDGINRNYWRADTQLSYDRIISKCKLSKQVYLDGRAWLIEKKLIEMTAGKNAYQMAVFNLGIAVRKQTGNLTGKQTATRPVTLPVSLPNIIHKDSNTDNTLFDVPKVKKGKNFIPPEIEEVFQEMKGKQKYNWNDHKIQEQSEAFIDFYTSNGWKVGKNKMSNWKSTVSTWLRNYLKFNGNGSYKSTYKNQPAIQPATVDNSEDWGELQSDHR